MWERTWDGRLCADVAEQVYQVLKNVIKAKYGQGERASTALLLAICEYFCGHFSLLFSSFLLFLLPKHIASFNHLIFFPLTQTPATSETKAASPLTFSRTAKDLSCSTPPSRRRDTRGRWRSEWTLPRPSSGTRRSSDMTWVSVE